MITPNFFTEYQQDVLTGLMLGDGCLAGFNYSSEKAYLRVNRSIKDIHYARFQQNVFQDFIKKNDVTTYFRFLKGKKYESCSFTTARSKLFGNLYKEWYASDKKQVPNSLTNISDVTLATWWCDDGSIVNNQLRFATQGFNKDSLDKLQFLLSEKINENVKYSKDNSGYRIILTVLQTKIIVDICKEYVQNMLPRKIEKWNYNKRINKKGRRAFNEAKLNAK